MTLDQQTAVETAVEQAFEDIRSAHGAGELPVDPAGDRALLREMAEMNLEQLEFDDFESLDELHGLLGRVIDRQFE